MPVPFLVFHSKVVQLISIVVAEGLRTERKKEASLKPSCLEHIDRDQGLKSHL